MSAPVGKTPEQWEGAGVRLRAFVRADETDLVAAFADAAITTWNPGPPEGPTAFVAERNDWSTGTHASWAVAAPAPGGEPGRLLGSVSLHKIDLTQGDAEIGYWVAPWARGRGVGAAAAAAAAAYGFARLGLHRVHLFHAVENHASCAVATRAGFLLEGTLRQSFRYPDGHRHDEHLHARLVTDPLSR
ncbi:Putative ribosomal N-acetyltransferase YdaF [Nocardioides dokdonensis FR1436]|uniref:Putative ribosomal N-acetyltransferase YdaF n=1 Tax=Nocardioides dokdonensis FR1436 TaxID=1300347 RepID=A0A1A9GK79_9ACTN|nr:GNAT family protein [Nocardioides dokdonensis]ANH38747.1 Putative ribosomal N-acetyltransferase YdaF [Nocardioides dokdonensis FR1436]